VQRRLAGVLFGLRGRASSSLLARDDGGRVMARPDVHIRLEYKTAKKLLEALEKGVYDKLTPAQADAIAEFCFEFRCKVQEAGA
jgi:hypothetical protein